MSEKLSLKELVKTGFELQRRDEADPVYGPIVRLARAVFSEAVKGEKEGLREEFGTFCDSVFPKQFNNPSEARRYRLYHYILGGTPGGNVTRFDIEGTYSITAEMLKLAEKYHIKTGEV